MTVTFAGLVDLIKGGNIAAIRTEVGHRIFHNLTAVNLKRYVIYVDSNALVKDWEKVFKSHIPKLRELASGDLKNKIDRREVLLKMEIS